VILNPAIIALMLGSFLVSGFAVYGSIVGTQIIRSWDIRSGSEQQLWLERKTYLVSTIFAYLLAFELLSLFLFIHTADHIHGLFVGAMCAAGSLNVNEYGYATLVLKIINFTLCGIWVILNHADNRGFDYPLIRTKYKFLRFITALLALETILQTHYFAGIKADVITSCCGTLFSEDANSFAGAISSLPSLGTQILFYFSVALSLRVGIHFLVTGRAARVFSGLATCTMVLSVASVISFVSLYFYELPTHHCPFCLLQREYHYIGYALYLCVFAAGIAGASVGVIDRSKGVASLKQVIPILQRRLCLVSMGALVLFVVISTYPMIFSDFTLRGY
jgi:hypothetical protein